MTKNHKILTSIIFSILVVAFVASLKKSYFTFEYKITYPSQLSEFVNIKDFVVPKIENKNHFVDNIISRNVRKGKIIILQSFEKMDLGTDSYLISLKKDVDDINFLIHEFLLELQNRSDKNYKTVEQNSKLIFLEDIIQKKNYLNLENINISKTFEKYEIRTGNDYIIPGEINFNLRNFYLFSIFILSMIISLIFTNIKKILSLIKKL
tara:strand:- start:4103 stop:4726 length:624 start_codon:yes stop_codon:yes gene_type:complete